MTPNVEAFLRVIREGETDQTDAAYREINGGGHFDAPPWVHPSDGVPTSQGGRAAGAYQFLGTTWHRLGLPDFSPPNQDAGAVKLIEGRGALPEVEAGDLEAAIEKLKEEWVSLPIILANGRAAAVFAQYGGGARTADAPQTPPIQQAEIPTAAPTPQGVPMPFLALLPLIAQFIPQIMTLIKPNSVSTAKDAAVAGTILDTVVKAAGIVNADGTPAPVNAATVGAAAEKMTADPALAKTVQSAVVTHPEIMPLLEVGGGVAAARASDFQAMTAPEPFWKASAVFWISIVLLPMCYWLVGSLIVGGVPLPEDAPWWVKTAIAMFGTAWNGESRSGGFNLVIGLVLGGICGVYYGISITQQKQQSQTPVTSGPQAQG